MRNIAQSSSFASARTLGASMQRNHHMPFGAEIVTDGVRFALWAPTAHEVKLVLDGAGHLMEAREDGWYSLVSTNAQAGSRYGYKVDDHLVVPDPASRFQPDDVHELSLVVDPGSYQWSDTS